MNYRVPVVLAALPLVLAACSGANPQLVEAAPDDGGSPPTSSPSPGTSPGTPGGGGGSTTPTGGGGSTGPGGGGSGPGAGTGTGTGGFDAGVAPAECPSGGTTQTTGIGDSKWSAKPFDTIACGTLAANASYFWTFTLPASTSTFGIAFTGGIRIELTLGGTTVDVLPGGTLPFRTNEPYYLQITPLGSARESYVLVVTEK
jgi:hypothetical protein